MRARPADVELVLEGDRAVPGQTLAGRVAPRERVWAVDLVRVEVSPAATLEFTAATSALRSDGSFALTVPEDAPPSVAGRSCALVWRVRARGAEEPTAADTRCDLEIEPCPS
jgi:hypothetical protein